MRIPISSIASLAGIDRDLGDFINYSSIDISSSHLSIHSSIDPLSKERWLDSKSSSLHLLIERRRQCNHLLSRNSFLDGLQGLTKALLATPVFRLPYTCTQDDEITVRYWYLWVLLSLKEVFERNQSGKKLNQTQGRTQGQNRVAAIKSSFINLS